MTSRYCYNVPAINGAKITFEFHYVVAGNYWNFEIQGTLFRRLKTNELPNLINILKRITPNKLYSIQVVVVHSQIRIFHGNAEYAFELDAFQEVFNDLILDLSLGVVESGNQYYRV